MGGKGYYIEAEFKVNPYKIGLKLLPRSRKAAPTGNRFY